MKDWIRKCCSLYDILGMRGFFWRYFNCAFAERREEQGRFSNLIQEVRQEDKETFKNILRMDEETYDVSNWSWTSCVLLSLCMDFVNYQVPLL